MFATDLKNVYIFCYFWTRQSIYVCRLNQKYGSSTFTCGFFCLHDLPILESGVYMLLMLCCREESFLSVDSFSFYSMKYISIRQYIFDFYLLSLGRFQRNLKSAHNIKENFSMTFFAVYIKSMLFNIFRIYSISHAFKNTNATTLLI